MKIISNFKDYYDSTAQSGIDASVVYHRRIERVWLDNPPYAEVPVYFPDETNNQPYDAFNLMVYNNDLKHTVFKIIGFCGKLYVGLFATKFDENDFTESYETAIFGREILDLPWPKEAKYRQPPPKVMLENCLERFHERENDGYFKALNSPVFVVELRQTLTQYESKNNKLYAPNFICNPPLSIYQFYRIIDPFSAFQQVQSYISGVLGTEVKPTIEVSNDSKIQKAGFDTKTSFRKDKKP